MKLRGLMQEKRLTGYRLAKDSGISQAQISRILNGQQPTLPTLQKLAKGLGVTLAELLDEETDQPNPAA